MFYRSTDRCIRLMMRRFLSTCPGRLSQVYSRWPVVCANSFKHTSVDISNSTTVTDKKTNIRKGPSLEHFIANSSQKVSSRRQGQVTSDVPFLTDADLDGRGRKGIHIEI